MSSADLKLASIEEFSLRCGLDIASNETVLKYLDYCHSFAEANAKTYLEHFQNDGAVFELYHPCLIMDRLIMQRNIRQHSSVEPIFSNIIKLSGISSWITSRDIDTAVRFTLSTPGYLGAAIFIGSTPLNINDRIGLLYFESADAANKAFEELPTLSISPAGDIEGCTFSPHTSNSCVASVSTNFTRSLLNKIPSKIRAPAFIPPSLFHPSNVRKVLTQAQNILEQFDSLYQIKNDREKVDVESMDEEAAQIALYNCFVNLRSIHKFSLSTLREYSTELELILEEGCILPAFNKDVIMPQEVSKTSGSDDDLANTSDATSLPCVGYLDILTEICNDKERFSVPSVGVDNEESLISLTLKDMLKRFSVEETVEGGEGCLRCKLCPKAFKTDTFMSKHLRVKHTDTMNECLADFERKEMLSRAIKDRTAIFSRVNVKDSMSRWRDANTRFNGGDDGNMNFRDGLGRSRIHQHQQQQQYHSYNPQRDGAFHDRERSRSRAFGEGGGMMGSGEIEERRFRDRDSGKVYSRRNDVLLKMGLGDGVAEKAREGSVRDALLSNRDLDDM